MSAPFIKTKKQLTSINSLLKQDKVMAAVRSLSDGVGFFLRTQLMKHEKTEFSDLIEWAVFQLGSDQNLKKIYPLKIEYKPGQEKTLQATLREILKLLQEETAKDAQAHLAKLEKRKQDALIKAQQKLDEESYEEAKKLFDRVIKDNPDDKNLNSDIGERYLNSGHYDDAVRHLKKAFKDNPKSSVVFNKLAIALRKAGRFEEAEKFFNYALKTALKDEYLLFNLGRVYIDWQKWDKAVETADKALEINPEFQEAQKMKIFASKKIS